MVTSDSKIIIVGGGVFGLTTALWLARSGYGDVTVFDRCQFDKNYYNPADGCDGASSDLNKVFRMAYGDRLDYQNLAIEARDMWLDWNKQIKNSCPDQLPDGINTQDELLLITGSCFLSEGERLHEYYEASLCTMERTAPEFRRMQFVKDNVADEARLGNIDDKWVRKLHALDKINHGDVNGFMDIQAGIMLADKSCNFARFLCEQAGVQFILGDPQGKIKRLIIDQAYQHRTVNGIETEDGRTHLADLVIVAAGPWTSSIIPEAHRTVEATAGTVMFMDIPKHRTDLYEKFHPDNFPSWSFRKGQGEDYYQGYGMPITKEGRIKFGFRGRKFTNFQDHPTEPGLRISTPRTKYTENPIETVPIYGLALIKEQLKMAFPELNEFGFQESRLCWYTDSVDNDYVIDYVPGYSESLFTCTGGSGHAFKFLPILGRHVKNQIERKVDQFTPLWKWRVVLDGQDNNGLSDGETSIRNMVGIEMADREDFKWTTMEEQFVGLV
ncbi:hypothetical protein PFICI_02262 [Pestalotiopsis fici W106-1]|uniref:FAD dependent oxidoreductase domain-containing protein n=1 Tax=Pestalotiopsis fici (strain W106-1 / CGMCC3.15140) TaxID=1229662 RepID=W3XFQ7_PESFW|nr:uncharacterized protein PFICI_02262 [Pestalotiopsis fici W106-1]ETS84237.1 hypothetical protein PFICI_02262 [Pestalotiopsis fici W106-1]